MGGASPLLRPSGLRTDLDYPGNVRCGEGHCCMRLLSDRLVQSCKRGNHSGRQKKWVKAQAEIGLLDKKRQNGYLLMKLHCNATMTRWRTIHRLQWNLADWNEVFGMGANFGATDPRNRIFALLGIANRSADSEDESEGRKDHNMYSSLPSGLQRLSSRDFHKNHEVHFIPRSVS
jgi:hypothetical protein